MGDRWVKFWFNYGGGIHGAWKRRRYTQIKEYAMELPRAAWMVQQKEIETETVRKDNH